MTSPINERTSSDRPSHLWVRQFDRLDYRDSFNTMRDYTDRRDTTSADNLWLLQHQPVFTQGQAGSADHLLAPGDIPVVQSDRGGHVTYHGPGQITAYLLLDLRRLGLGVRDLVSALENALIDTLAEYSVTASARRDAPGVYTADGAKIASLGLRVRRGCSYHGLNFNVDMNMEPWRRINPCGLGVAMTQLREQTDTPFTLEQVSAALAEQLRRQLGYQHCHYIESTTLPSCRELLEHD